MDNIPLPLPTQLLPCLAIPFVELFPDLCLGWFTPPSLNLDQYTKLWYLRALLHSIAWFPVFEMLLPMVRDGPQFSLLVIGVVACVSLRNFTMRKQIDRVITTPLWKTDLSWDKRQALFVVITNNKPNDINRFEDMSARYVTLPSKIAVAVMYGIINVLQLHLDDEDKMKSMAALAAFAVGGIGIGGARHGGLAVDCFFRCVFGAGFIATLHYLAEASDIVLIKSIS